MCTSGGRQVNGALDAIAGIIGGRTMGVHYSHAYHYNILSLKQSYLKMFF